MSSKNTIEFNGTKYDSLTGTAVTAGSTHSKQGNIDGFFRNPRQAGANLAVASAAPQIPAKQIVHSALIATKPPVAKPGRTVHINHVQHHKVQGATTLMRAAVKKPATGLKRNISVQYDLQSNVPSLIATKQSVYSLDDKRAARAQSTERSPLVARHSNSPASTLNNIVPITHQHVAVKPEVAKPVAVPAPQPTNKPIDIFEQAMANASNFVDVKTHRAHFRKQTKRHLASLATGTLALLVIGGFVAYSNSPSLQLKVASMRSGVTSAPVSDFKSAGFVYKGSAAASGKLTVALTQGGITYQLTQQPTNWDAADLLQNVGSVDASGFPTYSTLITANTSVYRLSNNSATWVTNGTLYQLAGTGALSDTQVAALVKNVQ